MDKVLAPAEQAKIAANYLRGTLAEELHNADQLFSKPATGVLKFHGIYQQDDRDLRKTGAKQYSAMVRSISSRAASAVLRTPWCSEAWPYSKRDDPQVTDSCEARLATQDESPAATFVMEELMVIGLRVQCSSPSGT